MSKHILLMAMIIFCIQSLCEAQETINKIDSTSNSFYIDEETPLPFSPNLGFVFSLPDSSRIILEVHVVMADSLNSGIFNTSAIRKLVDKVLSKGKYQVWWDGKDNEGNKMPHEKKYIYALQVLREVKTLNGIGYINIEAKSKVTSP